MILSDLTIQKLVHYQKMIEPFIPEQRKDGGGISYGTSSFGYDARLGRQFASFRNWNSGGIIDPGNFDASCVNVFDIEGSNYLMVHPGDYYLGHTLEYFRIPRDVMGVVLGKSTLARCGILINATPLEPGWEGQITLEISNLNPLPVRLPLEQGICQVLFFKGDRVPSIVYDGSRKYQGQHGVVLPRGNQERTPDVPGNFDYPPFLRKNPNIASAFNFDLADGKRIEQVDQR